MPHATSLSMLLHLKCAWSAFRAHGINLAIAAVG